VIGSDTDASHGTTLHLRFQEAEERLAGSVVDATLAITAEGWMPNFVVAVTRGFVRVAHAVQAGGIEVSDAWVKNALQQADGPSGIGVG
jgi:hypothetical protein